MWRTDLSTKLDEFTVERQIFDDSGEFLHRLVLHNEEGVVQESEACPHDEEARIYIPTSLPGFERYVVSRLPWFAEDGVFEFYQREI